MAYCVVLSSLFFLNMASFQVTLLKLKLNVKCGWFVVPSKSLCFEICDETLVIFCYVLMT
jgi:hypothetical protein